VVPPDVIAPERLTGETSLTEGSRFPVPNVMATLQAGVHFFCPNGHAMHTLSLVGLGAVTLAVVWMIVSLSRHRKPATCVNCGAPAGFGYSLRAESDRKDRKGITSVCLNCLRTKLTKDYEQFGKRALVIEPAANLPCDVFQPRNKWKDCKLEEDAGRLLSRMQDSCNHCGAKANFLWLTSGGLRLENLHELFAEGVSEILLRWGNSPPQPWWDTETPGLACQRFQTRLALSSSADEPHRDGKQARAKAKPLQRTERHTYRSGLDVETKIFSPSGRGGAFFLDIPFYRTH
jgi:hypothetical protein